MLEHYPEVLTVKEVRQVLFIGKNLVYSLLENGQLKGIKIGREWRILKYDLICFLTENEIE